MFVRLISVIMFVAATLSFIEAHAQPAPHSHPPKLDEKQTEQLFDNFLRWGGLPIEIKVSMYRTSTNNAGLGPYIGTITAKNTKIKIGTREEDALLLKAKLFGLRPGPHAFHLHENPDCRAKEKDGKLVPGLAAGGHLFAEAHSEGGKKVYKSHLGDLPNLVVEGDGTTTEEIIVPRLTLADLLNRSIMIHASADDNSDREACGIFR